MVYLILNDINTRFQTQIYIYIYNNKREANNVFDNYLNRCASQNSSTKAGKTKFGRTSKVEKKTLIVQLLTLMHNPLIGGINGTLLYLSKEKKKKWDSIIVDVTNRGLSRNKIEL